VTPGLPPSFCCGNGDVAIRSSFLGGGDLSTPCPFDSPGLFPSLLCSVVRERVVMDRALSEIAGPCFSTVSPAACSLLPRDVGVLRTAPRVGIDDRAPPGRVHLSFPLHSVLYFEPPPPASSTTGRSVALAGIPQIDNSSTNYSPVVLERKVDWSPPYGSVELCYL